MLSLNNDYSLHFGICGQLKSQKSRRFVERTRFGKRNRNVYHYFKYLFGSNVKFEKRNIKFVQAILHGRNLVVDKIFRRY